MERGGAVGGPPVPGRVPGALARDTALGRLRTRRPAVRNHGDDLGVPVLGEQLRVTEDEFAELLGRHRSLHPQPVRVTVGDVHEGPRAVRVGRPGCGLGADGHERAVGRIPQQGHDARVERAVRPGFAVQRPAPRLAVVVREEPVGLQRALLLQVVCGHLAQLPRVAADGRRPPCDDDRFPEPRRVEGGQVQHRGGERARIHVPGHHGDLVRRPQQPRPLGLAHLGRDVEPQDVPGDVLAVRRGGEVRQHVDQVRQRDPVGEGTAQPRVPPAGRLRQEGPVAVGRELRGPPLREPARVEAGQELLVQLQGERARTVAVQVRIGLAHQVERADATQQHRVLRALVDRGAEGLAQCPDQPQGPLACRLGDGPGTLVQPGVAGPPVQRVPGGLRPEHHPRVGVAAGVGVQAEVGVLVVGP
ncbi:hypothetical protein EES45_08490 [Streptomyces sp. ADI97-07]|nr:hypothetical protein EES45_08490 [Streptomyces sp. ADI97-07]